jgi:hypothetical protein
VTVLGQREPIFTGVERRVGGSMGRWLLLCSAICAGLRMPFFTVPLGVDEGGDSFIASAWNTTQGSMYGGSWLDRPPLLVLLYKVGGLGGDLGVRLLGMVAAILLVAGTMTIAYRISGPRAARFTGLITAIMTSSMLLGAVFTNNELLATVPVTYSVVALVMARDSDRAELWLFLAGFLASCAFLVKQSFVDVLVAGAVFLFVSWRVRTRSGFRGAWVGWWVAGVVTPLLATLAWFQLFSVGIRPFLYAIVGFRVDSLAEQGRSELSPSYMLVHLGLPVLIASGCLVLIPWAVSWLLDRDTDPQLALPLAVWLVIGCIGIVGGGHYYPHYFIQPVPALAVLSGCALAFTTRRVLSAATVGLLIVLAIGNVAAGATLKSANPPQQRTLAISSYLRANAHTDDSLYVMYARANLLHYAKMPTPYPYAWSMMVRTIPDAESRLRDVLRSPESRPTWIVEWHTPSAFGLDRSGETAALIQRSYVLVDRICGVPVLIRKDQADRSLSRKTPDTCARPDATRVPRPSSTWIPSGSAEFVWQ